VRGAGDNASTAQYTITSWTAEKLHWARRICAAASLRLFNTAFSCTRSSHHVLKLVGYVCTYAFLSGSPPSVTASNGTRLEHMGGSRIPGTGLLSGTCDTADTTHPSVSRGGVCVFSLALEVDAREGARYASGDANAYIALRISKFLLGFRLRTAFLIVWGDQ
jgi:hypothetical protein